MCKHPWDLEFLTNLCGKSWVFGTYRPHRQTLLLDREKAKLPADMDAIDMYRQHENLLTEARKLEKEIVSMQNELWRKRNSQRSMYTNANQLRNAALDLNPKKKANAFIHPCPGIACEGYLSVVGKCAVCEMWTCLRCFEQKGPKKDSQHACKEENVASAKHIKENTKRCPECGVPCVRVSGCTQMWCPQCHCSFSYRTGEVYHAPVHNPERDLWMAQGSAPAKRKRKSQGGKNAAKSGGGGGGGGCHNLTMYGEFSRKVMTLAKAKPGKIDALTLRTMYHCIADLPRYLRNLDRKLTQITNNKRMRLDFAMKRLPEDKMKKQLEQKDRRLKHMQQVYNIVTLLRDVSYDIINHMAYAPSIKSIHDGYAQYKAIVQHVRTRFATISNMTHYKTPTITAQHLLRYEY